VTFDPYASVDFGRALEKRVTEVIMKHTHVDDRILAEMSEEDRLDRMCRILEALEAGDEPRFNFYSHRCEQGLSTTR